MEKVNISFCLVQIHLKYPNFKQGPCPALKQVYPHKVMFLVIELHFSVG